MRLVLKAISFQSTSMGADAEMVFDETGGTFGRAATNDWVLPDPERYISGRHAQIYYENGRYFVEDTSTNGLTIEGQSTPIGKGNSVPVNQGDVLLLGDFRIEVNLEERGPERTQAELAGSVADILSEDENLASLDPLDLISPQAPSTHEAELPRTGSQENHSSLLHENFRVPEMSNDGVLPALESQQADPQQERSEPILLPETDSPANNSPANNDAGDFIDANWNTPDLAPALDSELNVDDTLAPRSTDEQALRKAATLEPEPLTAIAPESQPAPDPPGVQDLESALAAGSEQEPAAEVPTPPPAAHNGAAISDAALYAAFMEGLGVSDMASDLAKTANSAQSMHSYGELLRLVIESLMDLLRSRSSFKNEFRMESTLIRQVENNPLKFSVNPDEALRILFSAPSSGYMDLGESVQGCLTDMKCHQVAMVAGLQAIFDEFSALMSPRRYEAESSDGFKAMLQSITQKSRSWDQFCAECERLDNASPSGISGHFSEKFAQAYEERIHMLNAMDSGRT